MIALLQLRGFRKFCQRGSNSTLMAPFLLLLILADEGREDPNTTKIRP